MTSPLDAMIAMMKGFDGFEDEAARLSAPLCKAVAVAHIASGTDPDGKPWIPKKDGGAPLVNAAKAVTVDAIDAVVLMRVTGHEAWHQDGTKQGARRRDNKGAKYQAFATKGSGTEGYHTPPRPMIPNRANDIPPDYAKALKAGCDAAFEKLSGGR